MIYFQLKNLTMPYPCIQKQSDIKEKQGEEINNLRIIAKKELREEATSREQCLTLLREWINQNQDVENCITGKNSARCLWFMKQFIIIFQMTIFY